MLKILAALRGTVFLNDERSRTFMPRASGGRNILCAESAAEEDAIENEGGQGDRPDRSREGECALSYLLRSGLIMFVHGTTRAPMSP